jgi:outer membrane protein assembly factor BamA
VNSRSTNEITASYSAGWETTVPFQLTLGGPYKLGGYAPDRYPGGARAVLRVENRYRLGNVGGLFDFGSVVFADLGKMWSNGALFGVDSGLRASAGIGLRIATPAGSRQTYRLQLGIPLAGGVRLDDLVLSLSIDRLLRIETESIDPQLARSRDPAVRSTRRYLE